MKNCYQGVLATLILLFFQQTCSGFVVTNYNALHDNNIIMMSINSKSSASSTSLYMAGFGSSSSKGKNKKKQTPVVLKPKQQWDRYGSLKAANAVKVAVRVLDESNGSGESNEWLETGKVKSEKDDLIEMAVALQRGIIAEHSKRLYPLKILPKDRVEWAYLAEGQWLLVNKDVGQDAPSGMEKKIGFEGKPDPA